VNPIYGAAAVTGSSFASRFTFYLTLQVATVIAPGLLVSSELIALIVRTANGNTGTELHSAVRALSGLHGSGLFFAVLLAVAASYAIGYLSRESSFWLLGRMERISERRRAGAAIPVRQDDADTLGQVPPGDDVPALTRMRALSGNNAVDACIELHPVLASLSGPDPAPQRVRRGGPTAGGAALPGRELEAFIYCKLWLRRYAPELSVDQIEAEINIVVSIVIPVLLVAPVTAAWSGHPVLSTVIGVPVVLAAALAMMRSAMRLRRSERWEAIRNLIEDHMMRTALSHYDQPAVEPGARVPEARAEPAAQ